MLLALLPPLAWSQTLHVDPERGARDGDGSKAKPWRTLAEAAADGKLAALKGGETVLLYSGDHGAPVWSGEPAERVTVEAAPKAKPQLSRLEISEGRNWLVRGLTISPAFAEEPYAGTIASLGEKGPSSALTLEDCFIYTTLDTRKWTVERWKAANNGVLLGRHGRELTVRNCHVLNTRFAINLCSPDSRCEGNIVSDFSGDGIRVTRDGITVQFNVIKNVTCSDKDGDKNHDDAIQCFLFNKGTGTVRDVTIRGNLIVMREREDLRFPATLQGIGFFDGPLINFVVEGNVVLTSHWHGVSLYDAQQSTIKGNVVFTRWTDVRLRPWVQLGQKQKQARGNTVVDNYAHSFDLKADPSATERNNKKVTQTIFLARMRGLLKAINRKHGSKHPVSRAPRLARMRW